SYSHGSAARPVRAGPPRAWRLPGAVDWRAIADRPANPGGSATGHPSPGACGSMDRCSWRNLRKEIGTTERQGVTDALTLEAVPRAGHVQKMLVVGVVFCHRLPMMMAWSVRVRACIC